MPSVRVVVHVEIDGLEAPGFPWIFRGDVDEIQQFSPYEKIDVGGAVDFPVGELAEISVFACRTDRNNVNLQFDNGGGINLQRGGFVVFVGADDDAASARAQVTYNPGDATVATLHGLAGGT